MRVYSIVTQKGTFAPGTPPEAKLALGELLGEMQHDDGGDYASLECLRSVVTDILEEQGMRPIPEALPGQVAIAARQIMALEVRNPLHQ